jgi:biotin carboxyl carrier protein
MIYEITVDGKSHRLELERINQRWFCKLNGRETQIDAVLARPDVLSLLLDGKAFEIKREATASDLYLWVGSARYAVQVQDPRSLRSRRSGAGEAAGSRKLTAPMPGKVVRVLVEQGAAVGLGQGVVIVEAMKMQNEIKSPKNGHVRKLLVAAGDAVNAGDLLAIVE